MSINNKNITKTYGIVHVVQLSEVERSELREVTIGHGKLTAAAINIGVSRQTVYNAIHGAGISPDNLNAIRTYLQANKKVA